MYVGYSYQISGKIEFSRKIFETYVSNLMKIRPLGAMLFHADTLRDRQTDRHEVNSLSSQFGDCD